MLTNYSLENVCIFCEIKLPGKFTVSHANVMQRGMSSYLSDNHDNLTSQSITSSFGLRSYNRLILVSEMCHVGNGISSNE